MISQREVIWKYNKLLEEVKTSDFYKIDLTNRVNCYCCRSCGGITKTKDIDAGVTPFVHACRFCGGDAYSSFYKDIAPTLNPTHEWYRPTIDQCLKMRSRKQDLLEHVLKGGLVSRKIVTP